MSFKATLRREQAVGALGEPHASHAAVAEQREHAVGAELLADEPGIRPDQRGYVTRDQVAGFEKAPFARFVLRGAQRAQERRRVRIAALERSEPGVALSGRHLDRLVPE